MELRRRLGDHGENIDSHVSDAVENGELTLNVQIRQIII